MEIISDTGPSERGESSARHLDTSGSIPCLVTMLVVLWPTSVLAGNDESLLIGSEASMTAGAITATISDGSAGWYNPAGLAHGVRNSLDINGAMYGVRLTSVDELLQLPDGVALDAEYTDWVLVPSALSYVREIHKGVFISGGLFVPQSSDYVLRSSALSASGVSWDMTEQATYNEYYYTLAMGFRLSGSVRFGFSLYGVQASEYYAFQLGAGEQGAATEAFASSEIGNASSYGLQAAAGIQYDVSSHFSLGLVLTTPLLTAFTSDVSSGLTTAVSIDPNDDGFEISDSDESDWVWDMTGPMRVRLGVAYENKRGMISIDGSLASSVRRDDPSESRHWSGNGRVGGMLHASRTLSLGGGLFTDLNPFERFGQHYLGGSLGGRFRSEFALDDGRQLTFSTTAAFRYAYGWGTVPGLRITLDPADEIVVEDVGSDTTSHEIGLNLGSAVHF